MYIYISLYLSLYIVIVCDHDAMQAMQFAETRYI